MSFDNKKLINKAVLLACFSVPVMLLTACGEKDPKQAITEKSNAMWLLKIENKTDELYQFLPPSLKKILSEKVYSNKFGGMLTYKKSVVKNIDCDNKDDIKQSNSCTATVNIEFISKKDKIPGGATLDQKWVREDGDWWFYDK